MADFSDNNSPSYERGREDLPMNGKIRTREKCAHCNGKYTEGFIGREPDLVCPCGRTPRTYYIYIYWRGGDYKIQRHKGQKFKSYDGAYRILTEIRNKIRSKTFDIQDYISQIHDGRKLLLKWYKSKCKAGLSPNTLRDIKSHIRNYIAPIGQKLLPDLDCTEIRTSHIDDFYEALPQRLHPKTKDNIMTNLQSFINWLRRKEILQRNPEFPVISVPKPARQWSKKEDLLKALPHVPEHDRSVIHFMLYHPPRSGEVAALKVKDFLMDQRLIHIQRALTCFVQLKMRQAIGSSALQEELLLATIYVLHRL